MNILLTGAGGFIGKHLRTFLTGGKLFAPRSYELNLLDKQAVTDYLRLHHIDFIIHGASVGVRITECATAEEVATPNITMFDNLSCHHIPVLTLGSGAEYDKSRPLHKVKEEAFGRSVPKDPYGYSKYLISKRIENLDHVCNLRLFGVYGLGEHPSRVTSYILEQIHTQRPIILKQNVVFDFIYIADLCRIIQHFITHFTTKKFINVTPSQSISTLDLAHLAVQELQSNISVSTQIPGLNKEYTGDNSRLLTEIPNFEFTSYAQGIKKFYQEKVK